MKTQGPLPPPPPPHFKSPSYSSDVRYCFDDMKNAIFMLGLRRKIYRKIYKSVKAMHVKATR